MSFGSLLPLNEAGRRPNRARAGSAKGASLTAVGLALSLVFIGGAFGKAACGWLGVRLALLATVVTTEVGTAAAILTVLALPLSPSLALLPLLGVMLNGTSSVLYGTVPELVTAKRIERAFALFYTGILGSSAVAPVLYGRLGDAAGPVIGHHRGSAHCPCGRAAYAPLVSATVILCESS